MVCVFIQREYRAHFNKDDDVLRKIACLSSTIILANLYELIHVNDVVDMSATKITTWETNMLGDNLIALDNVLAPLAS